jgi:transcriptional regulator
VALVCQKEIAMHPNPAFRKTVREKNLDFARTRGFGTLAVNAGMDIGGGPLLSHVPFVLSDDGSKLEAHLVRSNPIVRLLEQPQEAVIAALGGDAYISPDWYGIEDQVPTWNYIAVHLRGELRLLPHAHMHDVLEQTTVHFEKLLLPKPPWHSDKMNQDVYERMLRQIVPVEMTVTGVDGTWKLSQNKPESAIAGAASGIAGHGVGLETESIAALMRDLVEAETGNT